TLYLLPPSRPARRSPLFPYTTLFRSLLASIAAPSFRSSHAGACRRAASSKAGFNIRRGNQVTRLRRCPRLLDLLRQPGIVLLCRSEEHTSELQLRFDLVCRPLLDKK